MRGFLRSAARAARLCFALVGTVIGAGFLSGAELVRFFPQRGFFALVCVSGLPYCGQRSRRDMPVVIRWQRI